MGDRELYTQGEEQWYADCQADEKKNPAPV
jgi:hypothetical protein